MKILYLIPIILAIFTLGVSRAIEPVATVEPGATITPMDKLTIQGKDMQPIVVIDMKTGKVTILGDPNEAAKIFWQAVETFHPACTNTGIETQGQSGNNTITK